METLDQQWLEWIRDNFARGCIKEEMLEVMLSAGIARQTALFNLENYLSHMPFQQQASFLFQQGNSIRTSDGQQMQVSMRIDAPDIVLLDNFMSPAECDELRALSIGSLTPSTVVDDATGKVVGHAERVSQGTHFNVGQNNLVKRIEARISELTSIPVCNGEGLQILNYVQGGEYRPHFDYFPDNAGGRIHSEAGGQRIITVIIYLNDVTAGGATIFPNLNLHIYPKKGAALYFSYFNALGQTDPNTLHGGTPVIEGEKWIATKWLRECEYQQADAPA